MWKERAEKAEAEVKRLAADLSDLRKLLNDYRSTGDFKPNGGVSLHHANKEISGPDPAQIAGDPVRDALNEVFPSIDYIYAQVKKRAMNDAQVLQLLATRSELSVTFEPKVLEVDGKTLRGGVALLLHRGYFSVPRNGYAVFNELQRMGRKIAKRTVYDELDRIAEWGFLTKEPDGYQATDLKVTVKK